MVQILAFESNPYQNAAAVLQTEAAGRRLAGGQRERCIAQLFGRATGHGIGRDLIRLARLHRAIGAPGPPGAAAARSNTGTSDQDSNQRLR